MVLDRRFLFVCSLFFVTACERIPEWEQSKVGFKSNDTAARLSEWSKWLWTCRGVGQRQTADLEMEKFRDYFRTKNLSSVDSSVPKAVLGSALLWDGRGYLIASIPQVESLRDIECRNASEGWSPAKFVGIDHSLDYAVLKVNLPHSRWGENPWLTRNEDLHADENFQILSSINPGQLDRMQLQLQAISPNLNTGIDSHLLLFLPPPPAVMMSGFVVDDKLRIVGFPLPTNSSAWTAAVSVKKLKESVAAILSGNPLQRAYLGFKLRIDPTDGFIVQSVQVGSPAYQVGLRPQDRLLEWDGTKLSSSSEWVEMSAGDIGKNIRFQFKRGTSVTDAILKVGSQD